MDGDQQGYSSPTELSCLEIGPFYRFLHTCHGKTSMDGTSIRVSWSPCRSSSRMTASLRHQPSVTGELPPPARTTLNEPYMNTCRYRIRNSYWRSRDRPIRPRISDHSARAARSQHHIKHTSGPESEEKPPATFTACVSLLPSCVSPRPYALDRVYPIGYLWHS